jgi:hypothetical protein
MTLPQAQQMRVRKGDMGMHGDVGDVYVLRKAYPFDLQLSPHVRYLHGFLPIFHL